MTSTSSGGSTVRTVVTAGVSAGVESVGVEVEMVEDFAAEICFRAGAADFACLMPAAIGIEFAGFGSEVLEDTAGADPSDSKSDCSTPNQNCRSLITTTASAASSRTSASNSLRGCGSFEDDREADREADWEADASEDHRPEADRSCDLTTVGLGFSSSISLGAWNSA
jgi:hypothetical protein